MSFDDILGPPVDPRYRRAVQRQRERRNPPPPVFACTTADIDAGYEPSDEQIEALVREEATRRATVTPIRRTER